jgi:voltage-gated potassium channel
VRASDTQRQLRRALIASIAVIAIGLVGFMVLLDESPLEALYQTVITVTGLGLGQLPDTPGAQALTIVLAIAGVAIFVYLFGLVIEATIGGLFGEALQERRSRQRVERLDGHYVICGYGRMGRRIAAEFREADVPYVVIDANADSVAAAREAGHLALEGSASNDATLEAVGVTRARGLIAAVGSDAENLYIVVNARELHPELQIVARASDDDAVKNLRRGGADHTVSPYSIAGREVATLMLKPHVSAVLDAFTGAAASGLRLEQIEIQQTCPRLGATVRELGVREKTGALVVAHRREDSEFTTRIDPDLELRMGDVLIGVGSEDEVAALELLFRPVAS